MARKAKKEKATEDTKKPKSHRARYEVVFISHRYSAVETAVIHNSLTTALDELEQIELRKKSEMSAIKSEKDSKLEEISIFRSKIRVGSEMRQMRCRVELCPEEGKKKYLHVESGDVLLTQEMKPNDFQEELPIVDEPIFEKKTTVEVWRAEKDFGTVTVAYLAGYWYAAYGLKIGDKEKAEILDQESSAFKERYPAIETATKRLMEWLKTELPDAAKGFENNVNLTLVAEKDKVE